MSPFRRALAGAAAVAVAVVPASTAHAATIRGLLDPITSVLTTVTVDPALTSDPLVAPLPITAPSTGDATTGGTLPVGGDLLVPLQDVATTLTALEPGTAPSGTQLAPVSALLRQLAALPGIDAAAGASLILLADRIDAQTTALPADLLATLMGTLQSVAATPGVPEPVTTAVRSITTLLGGSTGSPTSAGPTPAPAHTPTPAPVAAGSGPGSAAGAASGPRAKIGRVRISSARVDRKRGTVRIRISCPASGPTCKTVLGVARGKALQSASGLLTIKAGDSVKQTLKLRAASRRLIRTRTTKFTVGALLPDGRYAAKTVTAKAPKRAKATKAKS